MNEITVVDGRLLTYKSLMWANISKDGRVFTCWMKDWSRPLEVVQFDPEDTLACVHACEKLLSFVFGGQFRPKKLGRVSDKEYEAAVDRLGEITNLPLQSWRRHHARENLKKFMREGVRKAHDA